MWYGEQFPKMTSQSNIELISLTMSSLYEYHGPLVFGIIHFRNMLLGKHVVT